MSEREDDDPRGNRLQAANSDRESGVSNLDSLRKSAGSHVQTSSYRLEPWQQPISEGTGSPNLSQGSIPSGDSIYPEQ